MKNKKFIIVGAVAALVALAAFAQQQIGTSFASVGGTKFNSSGLTNWAIIGTHSMVANAQPLLTYLNATSDTNAGGVVNTGGEVTIWTPTTMTTVFVPVAGSGFTNTTSSYFVNSTNSMAAGTNIVIEHVQTNGGPIYEYAQVSTLGQIIATNIGGPPFALVTNFVYAITNTCVLSNSIGVGDNVYVMVPRAFIPVGVATLNLSGLDGIYAGKRDNPLLLTIIGGTNATINSVCARYLP